MLELLLVVTLAAYFTTEAQVNAVELTTGPFWEDVKAHKLLGYWLRCFHCSGTWHAAAWYLVYSVSPFLVGIVAIMGLASIINQIGSLVLSNDE